MRDMKELVGKCSKQMQKKRTQNSIYVSWSSQRKRFVDNTSRNTASTQERKWPWIGADFPRIGLLQQLDPKDRWLWLEWVSIFWQCNGLARNDAAIDRRPLPLGQGCIAKPIYSIPQLPHIYQSPTFPSNDYPALNEQQQNTIDQHTRVVSTEHCKYFLFF